MFLFSKAIRQKKIFFDEGKDSVTTPMICVITGGCSLQENQNLYLNTNELLLHGFRGGIIKWIWQFRWLQVRYKRLMYRYLLGFSVRVFLVRVSSHLTQRSVFCCIPVRRGSHCQREETARLLGAWGLSVPDYRAVYAAGVEGGKEPRELLVWGSVAKAGCVPRTAVWWVWHWLQGAAPICF